MAIAYPTTIAGVLQELDRIIDRSAAQEDPSGFFAYVYRRTTAGIEQAIEAGAFEDARRMERFDVVFANLYLKAYYDHHKGAGTSQVWQIALASNPPRLTVLQHVLLGMNAHINYDLAIAASRVAQGKSIAQLQNDYNKVNDILASLVEELQERISRVSPLFFLVDWLGRSKDEALVNFSMAKARQQAWSLARTLWSMPASGRESHLKEVDEKLWQLAGLVQQPPSRLLRYALSLVRAFETQSVGRVIEGLRQD